MHVLHLTWEYPPVVYGGLGRHVHALSKAQVAAGDEVTVVTQQPDGAAARETVDGVRIVRVPPSGPFPYHLPSLLTWVGFLDDAIRRAGTQQERADIVHVHDWVTGRAGTATADALDVPLVATVHATEAGRHRGWLPDDVSRAVHLIERWLVDEADALIVCSQSMATEIRRAHAADPARIAVIPNGIDASAYSPQDSVPPDLLEGSPRISFVGRIEWEKGVFTAVEAMPAVLTRYPDARLRIVGTGGQSAAVAELVARSGLDDPRATAGSRGRTDPACGVHEFRPRHRPEFLRTLRHRRPGGCRDGRATGRRGHRRAGGVRHRRARAAVSAERCRRSRSADPGNPRRARGNSTPPRERQRCS